MFSKDLTYVQKFFLKNAKKLFLVNIAVSFIAAFGTHAFLANEMKAKTKVRHDKLIKDFNLAFEQYVHPLEGMLSTLHYSNLEIAPDNFRRAAESRNLFNNFEAAVGFGFARNVSSEELSKYEARQKKVRAEFQLKRIGSDYQSTSIKELIVAEVIEPLEINKNSIGLVLSDEKDVRETAYRAMILGKGQLTQAIPLVESKNNELGFTYFLPIYKTSTIPKTEEERKKQLFGWAFAPLVASKLVAFVQSQNPETLPFSIEQVDSTQKVQTIFSSEKYARFVNQGLPVIQKDISIAGQNWKISSVYTPDYQTDIDVKSVLVGLMLCFGSLIFYYYSRLFQRKLEFDAELLLKTRAEVQKATFELTERKAFLQMVVDSLPAIVGYWDKNLENKLNNKLYRDFFGISGRQLPYLKEVASVQEQQLERSYLNIHGEQRILLTKYHPHIVNGAVEGLTVIGIDITELRRLENKNRESEELLIAKERLSLLGEMACGIAHEINNPLAVVVGKAETIKKNIADNSEEFSGKKRIISDLEAIGETALRMSSIVKGLRSFARNAEDDPFQKVPLKNILDTVLSLMQDRIKTSKVTINLKYLNQSEILFCNRTQLEQVFINLVGNSIDAISELHDRWVKIESWHEDRGFSLRFSDSGGGIPVSVAEKMMQAFFTTKEVGKGTGLGLSICKNILSKHGATFEYALHDGHTSFLICFLKKNEQEKQ